MPHPKGKPLSEATKARLREANLRRLEDPEERQRARAQMLHARSFKRHGNRCRVDPASLAPVVEAVQAVGGRIEAQLQRIGDLLAGRPAEAPAANHPGIPDSSPPPARRVVAYDPEPRVATLGGRPSPPLSTRPLPAGWGLRRHLPGTGGADWWTGGFVETTDERGRPATVAAFGPAHDARPFPTEAAARDFQRFERPLRGLAVERIA